MPFESTQNNSITKLIRMKIYVGNFDTQWNDENLKGLFGAYGQVISATVMMDVFTERSRGFGYVSMPDDAEATTAIESLHGAEIENRVLIVKMTEPEKEKSGSYKVGSGGINPYRFKKN